MGVYEKEWRVKGGGGGEREGRGLKDGDGGWERTEGDK